MHRLLIDAIIIAGDGTISHHVLAAIPGLASFRSSIRDILGLYVSAGFYLSTDLAPFDISIISKGTKEVPKMARIMLQVKVRNFLGLLAVMTLP